MTKNVGKIDMIIRIALGLIIGLVGFYFKSWWGIIGIVPFLTAFIGVCPAYLPFGINTAKKTTEK
ncbi:MAG: YgaP family membrane protein [Bacteroidales bacterium]|jgi:hypothetical protein